MAISVRDNNDTREVGKAVEGLRHFTTQTKTMTIILRIKIGKNTILLLSPS